MKNKVPEIGDVVVVEKNQSWLSGIIHLVNKGVEKTSYTVIVISVFPTLDGKLNHSIKAGEKVNVSIKQIKNIIDQSVHGVKPTILICIQEGTMMFARRIDGSDEEINIKVIDEDDGSVRLFKTNAHSFIQAISKTDENITFV